MRIVRPGTVGILPAGALGVAFFYYLTDNLRAVDERVTFIDRAGSASGLALRARGLLRIATEHGLESVTNLSIWKPDLLGCLEAGFLPEIVLVCTQPDQLLHVLAAEVRLLEQLHLAERLDPDAENLPTLVLCSNGIYFQRTRQFLLEKLEEATLLGRLPDLWPDLMPRLVAKLLRGVTIQTGHREGSGADAIYRPGPRGRTRLAGGDAWQRGHCAQLLSEKGGWFEVASHASPTRAEFDKALVNLTVNLLGQLHAIDDAGRLRPLKVGEILQGPLEDEARVLTRRVVEIGRAVHAYEPEENFETIFQTALTSCREHIDHVPSSLQWIDQQLRRGALQPRLTPTESWLVEPLIRYAHAAGLEDAAHYFEELTLRVEHRLSLATMRAGGSLTP